MAEEKNIVRPSKTAAEEALEREAKRVSNKSSNAVFGVGNDLSTSRSR
jgi:hypothetical protein